MNMHGLLRGHFGIMKMTAIEDYNRVKIHCIEIGAKVIAPVKMTKNKIEDATAVMIKEIGDFPYHLNRGIEYYKSL